MYQENVKQIPIPITRNNVVQTELQKNNLSTGTLSNNLRFLRMRELLGQWEMDELFQLEEGSWNLFETRVMPDAKTLKDIQNRYRVSLEALLFQDLRKS